MGLCVTQCSSASVQHCEDILIFRRLLAVHHASAGLIGRCAILYHLQWQQVKRRGMILLKPYSKKNKTCHSKLLTAEAISDTGDDSGKLGGLASVSKKVNTAMKCPSVSLSGFKSFQTCACSHTHTHARTDSCVTLHTRATKTWKTNRRRWNHSAM